MAELNAFGCCALCHNRLLAGGIPMFWQVTVERIGVDSDPSSVMAFPLTQPVTTAVCETCATTLLPARLREGNSTVPGTPR